MSCLTRGRIVGAGAVAVLSIPLLFGAAVAADRTSGEERLLLWLLGLKTTQGEGRPRVNINLATADELRTVPGIERPQALRIIAGRPYASLQELTRADFSPLAIERLSRFLTVDSDWPSALPGPAPAPSSR